MELRFNRHYTREEASCLLPQVRRWLPRLRCLRMLAGHLEPGLKRAVDSGADRGGGEVDRSVHILAEMRSLLAEFERREIQVRDLDRGLIDFPALIGGREVFLCWEEDEEAVTYWHDIDSGFTGRTRL